MRIEKSWQKANCLISFVLMKHFYAKNKVTICKVYKILIGNVGLEVNVLNFSKIEKEKQFKRTI